MTCPFHFTRMGEIKGQADTARDEFIGNGAIVNAMDGYQPPCRVALVQFVARQLKRGDVNHGNAETLRRDVEIGKRLLMHGIDFSENYIFRTMSSQDSAPKKLPIRLVVEAAKKEAQRW